MPCDDGELAELLGRLLALDDPELLRKRLIDVLLALESGPFLPCDAFTHPLGFIYLPLLRMPTGALRLHIWLDDEAMVPLGDGEVSPMHDHTWNMTSHVICGALDNVIVDIEADGDRPTHRVFEIHGHGGIDDVRPTDTLVRVTGTRTERVETGRTYTMDSGLIHCTEPGRGVVATLVAARRTAERAERALGPLGLRAYSLRRVACPPDRVAKAASAVLSTLA